MAKNVWVSPKGSDWKVKKEGNSKASTVTENKADAIKEAIKIAKIEKSDVIIQKRDGTIQDRDSYGNESKVKDKVH